jgi:hypothetical protein
MPAHSLLTHILIARALAALSHTCNGTAHLHCWCSWGPSPCIAHTFVPLLSIFETIPLDVAERERSNLAHKIGITTWFVILNARSCLFASCTHGVVILSGLRWICEFICVCGSRKLVFHTFHRVSFCFCWFLWLLNVSRRVCVHKYRIFRSPFWFALASSHFFRIYFLTIHSACNCRAHKQQRCIMHARSSLALFFSCFGEGKVNVLWRGPLIRRHESAWNLS